MFSRWSLSGLARLLLIVGVLGGFGLMAFPMEVVAQEDEEPPTLIKHLRKELKSKDAMRRQMALLDINTLAYCRVSCTVNLQSIQGRQLRIENETGAGAVVDLDALIPDLMTSYRQGPADGHRLLALSALLNIGNEKALERLIEEEAPQSEGVQRATQRGLASFYLEKYPELTERAFRTRRLTLDQVARAKALRMKRAKEAGGEEAANE
jgi:hypothetical protein